MKNILVLSILLAMAWSVGAQAATAQPERLSYDEFLENVRAGKVKSLTLGSLYYLEGTYSKGDAEKDFFCQRPLEPASDPLLKELLEKHNVSVVRKEQPKGNSMDKLAQVAPFVLLLLVPSVLLIAVLIYLVRINNKINQVVIR